MNNSLLSKLCFGLALVVFFNLTNTTAATAQGNPNQTPKVLPTESPYSGSGYLQYLPPDYNSTSKKYPLMIFLHGSGEKGNGTTDIWRVAVNGPPKLIYYGHNFPFIVISPQLSSSSGDWSPQYVDEFVKLAVQKLRIDESKIYVTGLSLGGGGTWRYSENYPQKIAAIVPIAPHYSNPYAACSVYAANQMAIWAFHGDADPTCPYKRTKDMIVALNACVPPMTPKPGFKTYVGGGHNVWDRAYDLTNNEDLYEGYSNIYDWILTKSKISSGTNAPPVANAGTDKTIQLPANTVTLNGTGSDSDGTIVSYSWAKTSGGAATLTNANSANLTASALVAGSYTFRLTVKDNTGASHFDDVIVTVNAATTNKPPISYAGWGATIQLPANSISLTGQASDPDGTVASLLWTKVSGPSCTLSGTTTITLQVSNCLVGTYVFGLLVTDNLGATAYSEVTLTVRPVNVPPVSNAGQDKTIYLPANTVTLTGTGSDPDGTVAAYTWAQVSGPNSATLTNSTTPSITASGLIKGTYVFKLAVRDNSWVTSEDLVNVVVTNSTNAVPTANAGTDKIIQLPTNTVTLYGTGSDSDGTIANYSWTKQSGGSATLTNANTANLIASALVPGSYTFRLTVTDNLGLSAFDDVIVTVNAASTNKPPISYAGWGATIQLPTNSISLTGQASDPDGTVSSLLWTKVSGPSCTLSGTNSITLLVSNCLAGTYVFGLLVTDNLGATAYSQVTLLVKPVNIPPVSNAGADQTITLPVNTLTLTAMGWDADGTVAAYTWAQVSGPGSAILANSTTQTVTVSALTAGTYVFKVGVRDNSWVTSEDLVSVFVVPAQVTSMAARSISSEEIVTEPEEKNDDDSKGFVLMDHPEELKDCTVTIYNERGSILFTGSWKPELYSTIFNQRGLYVYHINKGGKRIVGKIYITGN